MTEAPVVITFYFYFTECNVSAIYTKAAKETKHWI